MFFLAKHACLDLDCLFSAGLIYVLAAAINSDQGPAYYGIGTARSILRYLANLGNSAAASRLAEIDQMCDHLAVQKETPTLDITGPDVLMQSFSFERGTQQQRNYNGADDQFSLAKSGAQSQEVGIHEKGP